MHNRARHWGWVTATTSSTDGKYSTASDLCNAEQRGARHRMWATPSMILMTSDLRPLSSYPNISVSSPSPTPTLAAMLARRFDNLLPFPSEEEARELVGVGGLLNYSDSSTMASLACSPGSCSTPVSCESRGVLPRLMAAACFQLSSSRTALLVGAIRCG